MARPRGSCTVAVLVLMYLALAIHQAQSTGEHNYYAKRCFCLFVYTNEFTEEVTSRNIIEFFVFIMPADKLDH